jgi:hypothetical protein
MRRSLLITMLAVFCGLTPSPVGASNGRPVDIPERARGAARIVVAKAISVTPGWRRNSFGDELIVSEIALEVQETLKGAAANILFLDLEGGTLGDLTLHVSSLPDLKRGERAVFFLDELPTGSHVPHLKGLGILKLDSTDHVQGSSLRLEDIRRSTASVRR